MGITIDKPLTDIVYADGRTTFHFMGGNAIRNTRTDLDLNEITEVYGTDGRRLANDALHSPGIYLVRSSKGVHKVVIH